MVGLVIINTVCNMFVDYRGHLMGAVMESDMRKELFDHYQKLSFSFYDEQKTGQLMSRLTNDLFWLSELYHHGPVYSTETGFVGAASGRYYVIDRVAPGIEGTFVAGSSGDDAPAMACCSRR